MALVAGLTPLLEPLLPPDPVPAIKTKKPFVTFCPLFRRLQFVPFCEVMVSTVGEDRERKKENRE